MLIQWQLKLSLMKLWAGCWWRLYSGIFSIVYGGGGHEGGGGVEHNGGGICLKKWNWLFF